VVAEDAAAATVGVVAFDVQAVEAGVRGGVDVADIPAPLLHRRV